jgi:hypothetical protein
VIRSKLWNSDAPIDVPTIGDILKEVTKNDIGGSAYDADLSQRALTTLWS